MGRPKGSRNLVPKGLNPVEDWQWQADARKKIRSIEIINTLINHINGTKLLERDSQVSAGIALLRKTLPDLTAIDISAHSPPQRIAEAVLKARLAELIRSDPAMLVRLAQFVGLPAAIPGTSQPDPDPVMVVDSPIVTKVNP